MKKKIVTLIPSATEIVAFLGEKEIIGNVANARPENDVFRNCLLPINFI